MMSRDDLSYSQRHEVVSDVVMRIAHFVDANQFYLDEDLAPHCIALFMGAEKVGGLDSPQKTESIESYRAKVRETRRMIFEDAGVTKITKAFKDINKPNLHSPVISVLRQARNDLKNKK